MDWLAEVLLSNYQSRFPQDLPYIAGKKAEFAQLDRLGAMRAISSLDDRGRENLCETLGIQRPQLENFLVVLRNL